MSYDTISGQRGMFFDRPRNDHYRDALSRVITPESVVLDLGSGLGVLGFLAAELGARKVYMVDPAQVMEATREAVKASAFADRIECFQERIEAVCLPEPVDVIVSVFTGNFLLSEDLLPSLFVARDRWLKDDGVLIPDAATMCMAPVTAPAFYAERVDCWDKQLWGGALTPLREYAANSPYHAAPEQHAAHYLAPAGELLTLDFTSEGSAGCSASIEFCVEEKGLCHGLLGWFQMRLGEQWLSTAPDTKQTYCWSQVLLPLAAPLQVQPGQHIKAKLIRPEFGDWTWSLESEGYRARHSTFFSAPVNLSQLKKGAADYPPQINDEGRMLIEVLGLMNGERTLGELAGHLLTAYPSRFGDKQSALRFLKKVAKDYSGE